ncbi:MAG: hypothetical protein KGS61_21540, partial [Verrucomicrobia bacterium]|nr:hypothetical protein [Verrucomicrobiota bacterium]
FRCSPGVGGQLIAFGDGRNGLNNLSDRYIEFNGTTGIIDFYVYPGFRVYLAAQNIVTDDRWHSAVATLSPAGMNLYLDGSKVATKPSVTSAYAYSGYWQIGSSIADIDDVRIYSRALSDSEVAALFVTESKTIPYLKVQVKSIRVNMFVEAGKTNQLETTTDLVNWTAVGTPFVSSTPTLYQDFDVLNGTNGFFRIREIP